MQSPESMAISAKFEESEKDEEDENDVDAVVEEFQRKSSKDLLNNMLSMFHITPVKDERNIEIIASKVSSLMIKTKRFSEELSNKRSTSTEELYKKFCDLTLDDQYTLLSGLLQFFAQSAYVDQIQILPLCPESWGRLKVAKFLDAIDTQARNAIELRVTKGILAHPEYCRGNQPIKGWSRASNEKMSYTNLLALVLCNANDLACVSCSCKKCVDILASEKLLSEFNGTVDDPCDYII
ncbi:unnamed protein product [Didymodactylos carnosus]|uniref:Uncharacterized protein n=1 Tax=Didymodactylos carnosus TaxID=1234261 RepID=A0A814WRL8_9BILA|nr:unnamed protein product [Didymodactylos carnosus]CAF1205318.1 unnamed protein product [Didymodactylos carnosus]CAF3670802.1 unnamed protein product [Didymodactylos carnosus]CAF3969580.1 unnamed protein product [Didymodactylos carnosus]